VKKLSLKERVTFIEESLGIPLSQKDGNWEIPNKIRFITWHYKMDDPEVKQLIDEVKKHRSIINHDGFNYWVLTEPITGKIVGVGKQRDG
jgi:hypothetical protein